MRSTNPVLRRQSFQDQAVTGERMTLNGTVTKTGLLLVLAIITAAWTWHRFDAALAVAKSQVPFGVENAGAWVASQAMGSVSMFLWGGLIVGLIAAMVTIFKPRWGGITAPVYALAEGCALGGISAFFELRFPGVVLQAIMLTAGVLLVMLVAYRAGWIRVTDKFRRGVIAATGAIALLYIVEMGLGFFGINIPYINQSGAIGIGFSLLVVGLAAMNLALDFDMIEQGAAHGSPKYMEWYGAFALMVTLVWLYLEILRLLSKLRS